MGDGWVGPGTEGEDGNVVLVGLAAPNVELINVDPVDRLPVCCRVDVAWMKLADREGCGSVDDEEASEG
jgi:hypothetical protein